MDFEYDSDKDRWEYYKKAYKDIIINTDKLFPRNNRLVGTFSVNKINNQIKLKQVENKSKDRKSTRLNSSHANISYAVFCLKKKKTTQKAHHAARPLPISHVDY